MNSSTSNSEKASPAGKSKRHFLRFSMEIMLPYVLIILSFCYMLDRLARDRVVFRTPSLGAAKIHRIIHRISPEIPILGSSRALGAYIPDSLSDRAYNYGINGTGFEVTDMFLNIIHLRKSARTPIIINFDYEMWNHSLGDIQNYIPNISQPSVRNLVKREGKFKWWMDVHGIRFFSSFDQYVRDYINYRLQVTKVATMGAMLEKNVLAPAKFQGLIDKRLKEKTKWNPKPDQVRRLFEHFEKEPDRMFYMVKAPYHWSYYDAFEGKEEAHKFLDSLEQVPNVRVIDIDTKDWPDSLFVNTSHINFAGAKRFSRLVRDAIFEGPLPFPEPREWPPGYVPEWWKKRKDSIEKAETVILQDSLQTDSLIMDSLNP